MAKKYNPLRTYPIKKLCICVAIIVAVSLGLCVGFIFMPDELIVVRVIVWIMCGLFTLLGLILLFDQLFNYVEVKNDVFIKHMFLTKHVIPFNKIKSVKNEDGFYVVYVGNKKVCTFAGDTKEAHAIVSYMDKNHVKVGW